jgi:hypothetical protein
MRQPIYLVFQQTISLFPEQSTLTKFFGRLVMCFLHFGTKGFESNSRGNRLIDRRQHLRTKYAVSAAAAAVGLNFQHPVS